ncbi:hypothetical protein F5884DRAFT_794255 [Xylogone sp. PMI_703]|nr:hypothetical protein F5884DRAFT_794255 [Xylogone sp. PMI_703]
MARVDISTMLLPERYQLRGHENYEVWRFQITTLLESMGLEGHIDGANVCVDYSHATSVADMDPIYAQWKSDNSTVKMAISINIHEEGNRLVKDCITASDMWQTLMSAYRPRRYAITEMNIIDLVYIKVEDYPSTRAFIASFRSIIENIESSSYSCLPSILDETLFIKALQGKYPEWARMQLRGIKRGYLDSLNELIESIESLERDNEDSADSESNETR